VGTNHPGVNRIHWDLEDEPSVQTVLQTPPTYAEYMEVGSEGRPAPATGRLSILQAPGTYTVRLTVDGSEQTRTLEVRKDPNSGGTEEDIREQNDLLYAIKRDMDAGAGAVHRIEAWRVQLRTVSRFSHDPEVTEAAEALERKLVELEMELVDLRLTGRGQDGVRFEAKLLSKLSYLPGNLSNADFRPTDQEREVQAILHEQLTEILTAVDELETADVAEFNAMLRGKGLDIVGGGT
jgi:hypothetical protein